MRQWLVAISHKRPTRPSISAATTRGPAVSSLGHAATLSQDGRVLCYHQETRRMTHCRAPGNRQNYLMDHPKLGKLGPPEQQGSRTRWQNGKSTRLGTVWSTGFRCGRWPHPSAREMRTGTDAAGFGKNEAQPCDPVTSVTGPLAALGLWAAREACKMFVAFVSCGERARGWYGRQT